MLIENENQHRYISEMRINFARGISIRREISGIRRLREENLREIKYLMGTGWEPDVDKFHILLCVAIERHKYYDDRIRVLQHEVELTEIRTHELFCMVYSGVPVMDIYEMYIKNHPSIINEAKLI